MKMRSKFMLALSAVPFLISGCSNFGSAFKYEKVKDEFTSLEVSTATATFPSKSDGGLLMEVSLKCEARPNVEPKPFESTTISFKLLNRAGDGQDFSNLSIKFDDKAPSLNEFSQEQDISSYSNVVELYYATAAVLMFENDADRLMAFATIAGGGGLAGAFAQAIVKGMSGSNLSPEEVNYHLGSSVISAEKLMIRYETVGGIVHTSEIDIKNGNYRRVLKDCGWNDFVDEMEKNRSSAAPSGTANDRAGGVASPTAVASTAESPMAQAVGPMASDTADVTSGNSNAEGAVNPSFDCSKASNEIERMICSSPNLARLDAEMASSYRIALDSSTGTPLPSRELRQDQRLWSRNRSQCGDEGCLEQRYRQRIEFLNGH